MRWRLLVWGAVLMGAALAGCGSIAPMERPAILDATPGPAVAITDNTYTNAAFSVWYPPGWLATSSATFSAPWAVFTSPAGDALMMVAVDADDTINVLPTQVDDPDALLREEQTITTADDTDLTVVFITTAEAEATYAPLFARLLESLGAG